MEHSRLSLLRPRTVWDMLDDAFDLYRERFALFAGVAALPLVPAYLLGTLVTTLAFRRLQDSIGEHDSTSSAVPFLIFMGAMAAGAPIIYLARMIQQGVTSAAIEDRLSGLTPSSKTAWKRTLARFIPIFFSSALSFILLLLTYVLSCAMLLILVVPLVILVPVCIVLEKRSLRDGMRRGWSLCGSNYARALGLSVLLFVLELSLAGGLFGLVILIFSLIPGQSTDMESTSSLVSMQGAVAIAALFASPISSIATTLFYFDSRVRREGLDITALADETGVALAEVPYR